jgi:hypothetical protein
VGDFGAVVNWQPSFRTLIVQGEGAGSIRIANLGECDEQVERLEAVDAAAHCYRYRIDRTSLPVRDYVGEFRIEPLSDNLSRVVWSAHFELAGAGDGRTVERIRRFLHEGTEHLGCEYALPPRGEPRTVQTGIADADKLARSGSKRESVRSTPPAGAWNDTSAD